MKLREKMQREQQLKEVFKQAQSYAFDYADKALQRNVYPSDQAITELDMFVEELPTYRVKMGRSGENLAVQVSEKIKRPDVVKTDLAFLGKDIMSEFEDDNGDDEDEY